MLKISRDIDLIKEYISQLNLEHIFSQDVLHILDIHIFKRDDVVFDEDDTLKYLYIMLDGRTGVTPSSEMGKMSLLDIVIPGDMIGDMEYFNGDNYYYRVIALTDCKLLAIPVDCISSCFKDNILFYQYISSNLAQKMKRTSYKYSRALLYPLKNRLAKYLLDLSKVHGKSIPDVLASYTADYFGISQRHLRRVLSDMESDGILVRENLMVKILDMDRLKSQAAYK